MTYVGIFPSTPEQALQSSDHRTPALALTVLFYATRPVSLSGADEQLLCVGRHRSV